MTVPAQLGGTDNLPTMVAWPRPATGISQAPIPPMPPPAGETVSTASAAPDVGDVGAGGGQQTTTGHTEDVGHG